MDLGKGIRCKVKTLWKEVLCWIPLKWGQAPLNNSMKILTIDHNIIIINNIMSKGGRNNVCYKSLRRQSLLHFMMKWRNQKILRHGSLRCGSYLGFCCSGCNTLQNFVLYLNFGAYCGSCDWSFLSHLLVRWWSQATFFDLKSRSRFYLYIVCFILGHLLVMQREVCFDSRGNICDNGLFSSYRHISRSFHALLHKCRPYPPKVYHRSCTCRKIPQRLLH